MGTYQHNIIVLRIKKQSFFLETELLGALTLASHRIRQGSLLHSKGQVDVSLFWLFNHGMLSHLTHPSSFPTGSRPEDHLSLGALTFARDRLF